MPTVSTDSCKSTKLANPSKIDNTSKPQPQIEKLELFKTEFNSHFEQSIGPRISTQPERNNRRLDSLARLLERNLTCAAVKYDSENSQILIACNKIFNNSRDRNKSIESIKQVMNFLADHDATTEQVIVQLADIICDSFSQEERYSINSSGISKKELKTSIIKFLKNLYYSGKTTKDWRESIKNNPDMSALDLKLINKISRLARDFIKLRHDLIEEFGCNQGITNNSFGAINEKKYDIVRRGKKDEHAEMRLADKRKEYIGISKLCCAHCGLAVKIMDVNTRGKHGQVFKWDVPDFIKTPDNLKQFIGDDAYEIYEKHPELRPQMLEHMQSDKSAPNSNKNRKMLADSSDSDLELGVSCDTEQSHEETSFIKFNDNMKLIQRKESLRLLKDYGIPKTFMIKMLATSPDKFSVFTNKDVLTLLENNFNPTNLFNRLSAIYDENPKVFKGIIANCHGLINTYGIEKVYRKYNMALGNNLKIENIPATVEKVLKDEENIEQITQVMSILGRLAIEGGAYLIKNAGIPFMQKVFNSLFS